MDDPVPPEARRELARLADRWVTLPVGQARGAAPAVRDLAVAYVEEVTPGAGATLPDLGPGVVIDQLVVATHDAAVARRASPGDPAPRLEGLADDLAALRRRLP